MKNMEEEQEEEQELCAICQEDTFISCGNNRCIHKYCFECLLKWTKNRRRSGVSPRCPVCRLEYQQIYVYIESESVLNSIERIVYGQNRRHTPVNQYYLRRLINSPHWNHLDDFWFRMHILGLIDYDSIRFIILIDGRADIYSQWFLINTFVFDFEDMDALLKSFQHNAFVMAIMECNRHENV